MSNLGPAFLCYPSDFLDGMQQLNEAQANFYVRLVFRMYDTADAIRLDDTQVGKLCNSNARKWKRVREELIEMGKLYKHPSGAIINRRAARQMLQICIDRKGKHNEPDEAVIQRLAIVSQLFANCLGKVSQLFGETYGKNINKIKGIKKHPLPPPLPIPEEDKSSSSYDEDDLLFQSFWGRYPRTKGQNKKAVFAQWQLLSHLEQAQAESGVIRYAQTVSNNPQGAWLPYVYLRDRVFVGLDTLAEDVMDREIKEIQDAQRQRMMEAQNA